MLNFSSRSAGAPAGQAITPAAEMTALMMPLNAGGSPLNDHRDGRARGIGSTCRRPAKLMRTQVRVNHKVKKASKVNEL
jgi:hypothetical protein